jgi:hypothetical protein
VNLKVGDHVTITNKLYLGADGVITRVCPNTPNPYGLKIKGAMFPDLVYWFSHQDLSEPELEIIEIEIDISSVTAKKDAKGLDYVDVIDTYGNTATLQVYLQNEGAKPSEYLLGLQVTSKDGFIYLTHEQAERVLEVLAKFITKGWVI